MTIHHLTSNAAGHTATTHVPHWKPGSHLDPRDWPLLPAPAKTDPVIGTETHYVAGEKATTHLVWGPGNEALQPPGGYASASDAVFALKHLTKGAKVPAVAVLKFQSTPWAKHNPMSKQVPPPPPAPVYLAKVLNEQHTVVPHIGDNQTWLEPFMLEGKHASEIGELQFTVDVVAVVDGDVQYPSHLLTQGHS